MLNRVVLMGRLAAAPELKQTPNGTAVTSFRIAVNRTYNRDLTDWIDIVAWKQTAEFVSRYFTKGSMIIIEGSIQSRSYEDKSGNKRTAVEVVADQVHFAESKSAQASRPAPSAAENAPDFQVGNADDYDVYEVVHTWRDTSNCTGSF